MALFGDSKSKTKVTNIVEDRRVAASEGAIVAAEGSRVSLRSTSLDPRTVRESLGLARFAIQQATAGANKVAAGFTEASAASREREQQLLAAALTPDAAGAGTITNAAVMIAAIAAGAFVLFAWARR